MDVNVELENGLRTVIDWVTVSFDEQVDYLSLFDLIDLDSASFDLKQGSKFGNEFRLSNEYGIEVHYNVDSLKHSVLDITGSGCRFLEELWRKNESECDWLIFFNNLAKLNDSSGHKINRVTRLDIAIDDFKGHLDIPRMARLTEQGKTTQHKLRYFEYIKSGLTNSGIIRGKTLYLGKPDGDISFRFYDKLGEKISKNIKLIDEIDFWNRYEVQLRRDRAQSVVDHYLLEEDDLGIIVRSLMMNYLSFKSFSKKDKNKSRWSLVKWWSSFLNEVEPLKLTLDSKEDSFYKSLEWITGVSSTISLLVTRYGYDDEVLASLMELGELKQSLRHQNMINILDQDDNVIEKEKQQFLKELEVEKEKIRKMNLNDDDKIQRQKEYKKIKLQSAQDNKLNEVSNDDTFSN